MKIQWANEAQGIPVVFKALGVLLIEQTLDEHAAFYAVI
jgi:hypothetical protein